MFFELVLACLLIALATAVLGVLIANAVFVNQLGAQPIRLEPLVDDCFGDHVAQARDMDSWAREEGFVFLGCFRPTKVGNTESFMAIWQYQSTPTFFAMTYVLARSGTHAVRNWSIEYSTHVSADVTLDTASTRDAWLFPRPPGHYRQSFSDVNAADLWDRHQEGMRYLMREGRLALPSMRERVEVLFEDALARQIAYVRSLPLWYLRGPYWYFVRRYRYHGLWIGEQHRRGMIRMPNELG